MAVFTRSSRSARDLTDQPGDLVFVTWRPHSGSPALRTDTTAGEGGGGGAEGLLNDPSPSMTVCFHGAPRGVSEDHGSDAPPPPPAERRAAGVFQSGAERVSRESENARSVHSSTAKQ